MDPDDGLPASDSDRTFLGRTGRRIRGIVTWSRALRDELGQLPVTLRSFREGAANFEVVTQRLAGASRALEDAAALYESTFADSARRSNAAIEALRAQLEVLAATASPERLPLIGEVQASLESLARMNPFWPGTSRQGPDPPAPSSETTSS